MTAARLDISDAVERDDEVPRPCWDRIAASIAGRADPEDAAEAWTYAARQWLGLLQEAFGPGYGVEESSRTLLLSPRPGPSPEFLLGFAAECRRALAAALPGIADFRDPGKPVLVVLASPGDYYRYVAAYYPEGRSGGSSGMQIRDGYPHIAVCGVRPGDLERIVAHEMTHAALAHLALPQWVEEGLAQMFEHDLAGRRDIALDARAGRKHKQVWSRRGLDEFWSGEAFFQAGKVQELAYQLAEVLVRLLLEEYRPAWFGLAMKRRRRLLAFLGEARADDAGEAAAKNHLGRGLGSIASLFLGPGDWAPRGLSSRQETPP